MNISVLMKSCKNWKNKGNSMHPYIHLAVCKPICHHAFSFSGESLEKKGNDTSIKHFIFRLKANVMGLSLYSQSIIIKRINNIAIVTEIYFLNIKIIVNTTFYIAKSPRSTIKHINISFSFF